MVKNQVLKYISSYDVSVEEEKRNRSSFLTVNDNRSNLPPIVIHFVDGNLYSIDFIGCEFFEISDEDLVTVLSAVLSGNYEVKKSIFGKRSIKVRSAAGKYIIPERVGTVSDYEGLPRPFPKGTAHH
jgi:hypothetical protein